MDKTDELLEKCLTCKDYPHDCGIYLMMALWKKECKFYRKNDNKG